MNEQFPLSITANWSGNGVRGVAMDGCMTEWIEIMDRDFAGYAMNRASLFYLLITSLVLWHFVMIALFDLERMRDFIIDTILVACCDLDCDLICHGLAI